MSEVTIITPTYQATPEELHRCLDSTQRQTFRDFEQIVCSDGLVEPTTRDVVTDHCDPRLRYGCTNAHLGNYANELRRRLLAMVNTPYVMFLDDDNFIFPTYLEKMLAALRSHSDAGFAICAILHYGPLIAELGRPPVILPGQPKRYHIDPLQVLAKTEIMRQVGWFVGDSYSEDGVTFEALGKVTGFARVPEVLCVHSNEKRGQNEKRGHH